jgi:hypothetical protein
LRIIDMEKKNSVKSCSLYLTVREAKVIRDNLTELLRRSEASEQFHLCDDNDIKITCSIITPAKLKNMERYSKVERKFLKGAV